MHVGLDDFKARDNPITASSPHRGSNWWDRYFLGLARYVSSASKDPSTKCGAVIVAPDHRVVSMGFNGFPTGMPDYPEHYANREIKYSRVVHAEMNAVLFAHQIPPNSTLYTWPIGCCDRCTVFILQAGIREFVAPKPSADALSRWGQAFALAAMFVRQTGGITREIDLLPTHS